MSEIVPPAPLSTDDLYRPMPVYVARRMKNRLWLHLLLLLLTIFTTLVQGARMEDNFRHGQPAFYSADDSLSSIFPVTWALKSSHLLLGVPFSCALMLILMAHEMGHYLCCRYYGVAATLPFFIPFPTLFGTMGAFIQIRSPIRSRAALFDIGIAGPIAGFVVALGVLFFAMPYSQLAGPIAGDSRVELGYPLIFQLVWHALPLPQLKSGATSLHGIYLHPTAIAAWVGMFATALNLLPGGQLDGGHIVFAIAPRARRLISSLTILVLIPMALYRWAGWLIWAILLWISGLRHPMVPEWPEVRGVRRWLAGLAVLMLAVTISRAPIASNSLIEVFRQWRMGR